MNTFNRVNEQIGRHRWTICALVFFATTINYVDRNVLGLLKPMLSEEGVFGADKAAQEQNYANVVICFQLAYAFGMLLAGRLVDWLGTKSGYAYSLIGWSIAAIGHAFGHHTWSFGFWRAALGFTESGNFPAANKTIAEWFPRKERAFATGLYNSGANVGAIVAPITVPFIANAWGWEWAFILTGAIGLLWLVFWYRSYEAPAAKLASGKLSQSEFNFIHSDPEEAVAGAAAPVRWISLLCFRQTWAFAVGKFLSDPVWWFYLFWLPAFLNEENQRRIATFVAANPGASVADPSAIPGYISWPWAVALVYTISTLGSVFGGWLPKRFAQGGMDLNRARKLSMFLFALAPLAVLLASRLGEINIWYAVLTISLATAAHQAWSCNIFTTVSDMFPKRAVASVTGIGGMAGSLGGVLLSTTAGQMLKNYAAEGRIEVGYAIMFTICGVAYLLAWFAMHLLAPKFQLVDLD
jgi:ACS family hexuronate transporter-like MFS transporter